MKDRPNILLYTTDQHRGDFIGLEEGSIVETPTLDAFPREGAYFPHAYSEIPSTTGARRIMLGGQGSHKMLDLLDWIDRTAGRIAATVIMGGIIAVIAFMLWCLYWSLTQGQAFGSCLEHAGRFLWEFLSGMLQ